MKFTLKKLKNYQSYNQELIVLQYKTTTKKLGVGGGGGGGAPATSTSPPLSPSS